MLGRLEVSDREVADAVAAVEGELLELLSRLAEAPTTLRELLAREGIRHVTTQPYRPRTNGKVERFIQTLEREWAYGLVYRSHRQRNQALPHWLDHYNRGRPHGSLGGRPPSSRVQNVCRQDT